MRHFGVTEYRACRLANIPPAIAKALAKVRWFRLVPEHLHLIDNSHGLGHRDEIDLGGG